MLTFIYMLMKQNINFWLINNKIQAKSILMILKLFLNTELIWMIFIKILKNKIQIRNIKYYLFLLIWLLICLVIKKLTIPETSIRGSKVKIYVVFIARSYLAVPENIRLNPTHYFLMKIPNKRELQPKLKLKL